MQGVDVWRAPAFGQSSFFSRTDLHLVGEARYRHLTKVQPMPELLLSSVRTRRRGRPPVSSYLLWEWSTSWRRPHKSLRCAGSMGPVVVMEEDSEARSRTSNEGPGKCISIIRQNRREHTCFPLPFSFLGRSSKTSSSFNPSPSLSLLRRLREDAFVLCGGMIPLRQS